MAGSDPRKQLMTLIHDFASEKSQGERRLVGLRNRIEEMRSELEVRNAELEEAKQVKESTEQEVRGYEVELAMNEATIQTLESRLSMTQEEVSTAGSDLEALKDKEAAAQDDFISQMFELNSKIRKFQHSIAGKIHEENYMEIEAGENCDSRKSQESIAGKTHEENYMEIEAEGQELVRGEVSKASLIALVEMLACVVSEIAKVEEEYKSEKNIQKQVQQELVDCERKVFLMENTMNVTRELQDLTRNPFQECFGYQLLNCLALYNPLEHGKFTAQENSVNLVIHRYIIQAVPCNIYIDSESTSELLTALSFHNFETILFKSALVMNLLIVLKLSCRTM